MKQRRRFWSPFAARAPTQRGIGDTEDVTICEAGTSGAAREVWERLFSVCGGFWAALGAPRVVQERPMEAKSSQPESKSEHKLHQNCSVHDNLQFQVLRKYCPPFFSRKKAVRRFLTEIFGE